MGLKPCLKSKDSAHSFGTDDFCRNCGVEYRDWKNGVQSADMVNAPPRYNQAGIECIDATAAATSGKTGIEAVCVANVVKYLWRYELKNGVEDVKKARGYLDRLIGELEK